MRNKIAYCYQNSSGEEFILGFYPGEAPDKTCTTNGIKVMPGDALSKKYTSDGTELTRKKSREEQLDRKTAEYMAYRVLGN